MDLGLREAALNKQNSIINYLRKVQTNFRENFHNIWRVKAFDKKNALEMAFSE